MTFSQAEKIIEECARTKEQYLNFCIYNCMPHYLIKNVKRELKALRIALKTIRKRKQTIAVHFKPGDHIYYKDKTGKLQESTIKSVEPLYVHETPEGDKCIFYDNFIGVIIFPRDVVGG